MEKGRERSMTLLELFRDAIRTGDNGELNEVTSAWLRGTATDDELKTHVKESSEDGVLKTNAE